jgi:hypothetical protein
MFGNDNVLYNSFSYHNMISNWKVINYCVRTNFADGDNRFKAFNKVH